MDRRAQGCVKRRFLHADIGRLRPVHSPPNLWPLRGHVDFVCVWADVQAHAGDAALCAFAPGLLAAQ